MGPWGPAIRFICDFVVAVKICQADIFMMYFDLATIFNYFVMWLKIVLPPAFNTGLLI
jgi:hypothetical protein